VGIDYTINAKGEGENSADAMLAKIFDNELPTLVFEATGNIHSMQNSFNYVGHGGKLVFVGVYRARVRARVRVNMVRRGLIGLIWSGRGLIGLIGLGLGLIGLGLGLRLGSALA